MFCSNCGKKIEQGGRYCISCGNPVSSSIPKNTVTINLSDGKKKSLYKKIALVAGIVVVCIVVFVIVVLPLFSSTEPVVDEPTIETPSPVAPPSPEPTPTPEPPVSIQVGNTAGNIGNLGFMAIYDDWIYYSIPDIHFGGNSSLWKMRPDESEQQKLTDDAALFINVIGDRIYYSNASDYYRLYSIKTDGSDRRRLNDSISLFVTVQNNRIFYIDEYMGTIYSMTIDGADVQRLVEEAWHLNVVGEELFFIHKFDEKAIYAIHADGTGFRRVNNEFSENLNVVDDWIYYTNVDDEWRLYRIRTDGTGRELLNDEASVGLNAFGGKIFYINWDDEDRIYSINLDGTGRQKLSDDDLIEAINVIGDRIYYIISGYSGFLFSIRTNGSDKRSLKDNESYEYDEIVWEIEKRFFSVNIENIDILLTSLALESGLLVNSYRAHDFHSVLTITSTEEIMVERDAFSTISATIDVDGDLHSLMRFLMNAVGYSSIRISNLSASIIYEQDSDWNMDVTFTLILFNGYRDDVSDQYYDVLKWLNNFALISFGMIDMFFYDTNVFVINLNYDEINLPNTLRINAIANSEQYAVDYIDSLKLQSGIISDAFYVGYSINDVGELSFEINVILISPD